MTSNSHSNVFLDQLNLSYGLIMSTINVSKGVLKNMEMHYRSVFDKIVRKISIAEEGIFRTVFQAGYPKIHTNMMIYIPMDDSKDEGWDIFT